MWVQSACCHAAFSTVGKAPAALTRGQAAPAPASKSNGRAGRRGRGWGGGGHGSAADGLRVPASKGRSRVSCCRCSGTPCRSWHTRYRGPGGRCWESAGSEPPTEVPAPSPGRPCHQVLLCFSASMGASAAQEWGVPCALSPEAHLPRSVRGR